MDALVSGMTDFWHIVTMSRINETLRSWDMVDLHCVPCVGLLRFNLFEIFRKSVIY